MTHSFVESTCVFGSVARSSTDSISDKDILIVSNNLKRRIELTKQWKAEGWSVSAYTPNRFKAIIKSGSLFVQHIKHEGVVLSDRDGWLRHTLNMAKPKPTYSRDAQSSVYLAMPIERFCGDQWISQYPIVADLAFVCVRNFGINYLADRGNLIFDYQMIVDRIGIDHALTNKEIELLHSLRTGKAVYRRAGVDALLPGTVADLRSVLGKLIPNRRLEEIPNRSPVRGFVSGYTCLRDFEASVVSHFGSLPTQVDLTRFNLEGVWKWVTRPQEYAWNIRNFDWKSGKLKGLRVDQLCFPNTLKGRDKLELELEHVL